MRRFFGSYLDKRKRRGPMPRDYASSLSELKKTEEHFIKNGARLLKELISSSDGKANPIRMFSAEELEKATDNYSDECILVRGGMYAAYKGTHEGRPIVVRRLYFGLRTNFYIDNAFNEIVMLSQINHKNVVKLLGCCIETEDPRPVYEFISNGNLYNQLHSSHIKFSWECRLRIATEVASAVNYFHSRNSKPIIHRDIRSVNILLDDHYTAKLTNFGSSEMILLSDKDIEEPDTMGTNGQVDASNFSRHDVHNFGVLLLDLLTGNMPEPRLRPHVVWCPPLDHFISYMEEKRLLLQLESGALEEGKQDLRQWIACAELAVRCIEDNGLMMKEVVQGLTQISRLR